MRVAELILVQPDGKIKRLVVKARDDSSTTDESMIVQVCNAMSDREFREMACKEITRSEAVECLGLGIYSQE
jgi:hypothetical protein